MTSLKPNMPLRVLVSPKALPELESLLSQEAKLSVQLMNSAEQNPGAQFDVALISRDVTATSTKQKIIPATQAFYDLLLNSSELKWVQIHSAGADRQIYLDLMKRGVTISGSSGVNAAIVMQNAIAGILMLARKFPQMQKAQTEHRWDPLIHYPLPQDLSDQTAVIVGRGPIGDSIAKTLQVFGVKTISVGFNAALKEKQQSVGDAIHISQLHQVLPQGQWLVLACPLSDLTRGLIDHSAINLLPNGAYIINIARGEIIHEPDLITALHSKKLGGAYLDVFVSEPLDPASPLWDMENVIVTPHSAGHSAGNEQRVLELFVKNLHLFAQGQVLKNQIAS
ncbi:D-2-hydroxyacid dehydrogenase [Polynucleobacter sp. AP-Melu-500A-A1]|uniref:D-2-hydroxyacid dehydrogenase n=1 Tax=Polynucleobacter sp. AP-Melu-500A-A1 TaxID=2576929 RepID=UPI001C0E8E37|nr:D-2-hydroxyacid dehydrogenase [Polynucleobacter sp. AP-Melu-500A-A1]MBU3631428.1 D-2-hydroxyacid dehydrogenase [Polynucleobacter sp. AP-Melu-500A-A1]